MLDWLRVETTFFTILEYRMSYIEFFGTVSYLLSVWLVSRRNMLTWPIGMLSVSLYMILFYQIRLYADAIEQVYYLGISAYGWLYWSTSEPGRRVVSEVDLGAPASLVCCCALTVAASVALGIALGHVHEWFPRLFPEPASYPFTDALTTASSLTAMWLIVRKRLEAWIYWIVVDVLGIWLYFQKNVLFIGILYVVLLFLAIRGLIGWMSVRQRRRESFS
jgi:nicotinamide mononucleotide transporter